MLARLGVIRWRNLLPFAVLLLPLVLLAACGGGDAASPVSPTATKAPEATQVLDATPTPVPEPTAAPTQEPVQLWTPAPEPTATPQPTATPEPTQPQEPTATPTAVAAPAAPVEPCEGTRGGEVGNCAPELAGTQQWINTQPFTMESLLGKVVLIDFWTYSCINCIRTLPFLQTWHDRYADEGLVILGVHTPEFEFEKVYQNVVDATVEMGVAWPVVQDNDFAVWRSYSNRFWPAKYLIDSNGVIQYRHFGEGKYAETEQEIRKLLAEIGAEANADSMPLPEDQQRDDTFLQAADRRVTPELFAGWSFVVSHYQGGRGLYVAQIDTYMEAAQASYDAGEQQGVVAEFVQPAQLAPDRIYFHGPWSIGPENAVHARETEDFTDAIILVYSARSVNAVLTSASGEPYKVIVTVNNEFLTEENKGLDVEIGDDGESYVMVTSPKAYRIVEHDDWEENQILAMSSLSDDFGLFSFTFGTYEDGF